MATYTLRHSGMSHDPDDYVFHCNGAEVGRCYLRPLAGNNEQWSWSIYIGIYVKRIVEGVSLFGYCETLGEAEAQFRENFDRLIAAGVVALPDDPL
jgi:hypothetical protein